MYVFLVGTNVHYWEISYTMTDQRHALVCIRGIIDKIPIIANDIKL